MGQKYAGYSATGAITGFYDDVDSPVPEGITALEISDAEWLECLLTPGYTVVEGALVAPPAATNAELLAAAAVTQLAALAAAFATASTANVTDSNSVTWSGGMSSAVSIYGAVQLASAGGATSVTLYDASNVAHALTIAEGTTVAAVIGAAYQTVFAEYQTAKVSIATLAASSTATVAQIEAITLASPTVAATSSSGASASTDSSSTTTSTATTDTSTTAASTSTSTTTASTAAASSDTTTSSSSAAATTS